MTLFSSILKQGRSINGLTQQTLLDKLVEYSESFATLNLTTLSRWERGITTPSPKRQSLIARCLDIDEEKILKHRSDCPSAHPIKTNAREVCERSYHQPYYDLDDILHVKVLTESEKIEDYKNAINHYVNKYLKAEIEMPSSVVNSTLIYSTSSQLIGHMIAGVVDYNDYLKCKSHNTQLKDLVQLIKPFDTMKSDREYTLVIPCSHAMDARARAHMLLYIYDTLIKNRNIRNLVRTCTSRIYFPIYCNDLNAKVIGVGMPIESFNGVKWRNKRYSYTLLDIDAADVTSNKGIKYCSECKINFDAPITSEILNYQSLLN
ncbi:helix-turn-helix domain-containing protein [Vibrio sonorensis]|uniref:helix-turn-helix domain-containing protein n=1 Tax=Vibrio sonorensis TaxID=1004316 RepID=UPI0008DA549B|nr:helix-turn-helix transcriptional regulator [Vibrio sonorensis]